MPKGLKTVLSAPPLGWNSYDCLGAVANERRLLENLEAFAERLRPFGYEYFVLDIGWYSEYTVTAGHEFPADGQVVPTHIDSYGRYLPARVSFPNGLEPIIARAHELGIKFGIHLMRGIPRRAVAENMPIYGTPYHARDIADLENTCRWCSYNYGVDMDRSGAQAYYNSVIALLAEWGVDFLKADDLVPHPRELNAIADAVDKAERPIVLSLSPGGRMCFRDLETYQRGTMVRITDDMWDESRYIGPVFDSWYLFQGIQCEGFWPDLDIIPLGKLSIWRTEPEGKHEDASLLYGLGSARQSELTPAQKRTVMTQRALAASPLMMGGHLPETPDEDYALLTNADMLACNQNGIMGRQTYSSVGWEVWMTPDKVQDDAGWIGIFNRSDKLLTLALSRRMLGLGGGRRYALKSIWTSDRYQMGERLVVNVQADDVLFLGYARSE